MKKLQLCVKEQGKTIKPVALVSDIEFANTFAKGFKTAIDVGGGKQLSLVLIVRGVKHVWDEQEQGWVAVLEGKTKPPVELGERIEKAIAKDLARWEGAKTAEKKQPAKPAKKKVSADRIKQLAEARDRYFKKMGFGVHAKKPEPKKAAAKSTKKKAKRA